MSTRRGRSLFGVPGVKKPLPSLVSVMTLCAASYGCSDALLSGGSSDRITDRDGGAFGEGNGDGDGNTTSRPDEKGVPGVGWSTRYPRLSHVQWENAVRDLLRLGAQPGLSDTFSLDPDDARFDTVGTHLVSSNLWLDYQRAAETVAATVTDDSAQLNAVAPGIADKDAFLAAFLPRAYRRPVTAEELTAYGAIFDAGVASGDAPDAFASGARLVIATALQSPHFLYRPESSTQAEGDRIWLQPYEVASRLSFGLWNSMPSDELLAAAGAGELTTAESVMSWASAMIADPRALKTLVSFHEQFFHTKEYGTIAKNETLFPTFTLDLAPDLQKEADLFIEEISVRQDQGIAALLTSNVTYVNNRIAEFYGLNPQDYGTEMTRVELDPARRAGILTQLGFLSRFGSQAQSDPILRGVHISLEVLCSNLPAPPADIPPLPEFEPDQTNRERVELATAEAPCNACHEPVINPLGFAFENFDAVGAWRDTDNGQPVDASASYELDGEMVSYSGAVELVQLLSNSPSLHRCYTDAWLEYLAGRPVAQEEELDVDEVAEVSRTNSAASTLLSTLVALDTFRARPKEDL